MRLPVTPQISTKDGTSNRNARLTNCLKESKKGGDKAVVRPGLVLDATASGLGHGLAVFDNHLISVYGSTLGFDPITTTLSASIATYTPIANRVLNSIGYNGAIYVAVGFRPSDFSARIYTSTDGQSWTSRAITSGYEIAQSVLWNGTTWICFAEDTADTGDVFSLLSSDGINWNFYDIGSPAGVTDTSSAYGGGYFFSNTDNGLYRSSDGQTWAYMGGAVGTFDMAYGNGYIVSVGSYGGAYSVAYSSDLGVSITNYTPASSQTITRISGICFDGTRFVAISDEGDGAGVSILAGTTGANLVELATITSFDNTNGVNKIAWNGSCYVATSSNGAYAVSDDAITWTEYSSANAFRLALCSGASGFNFFADGTPGLITATASMSSIPALATITGDHYDFAQSPI